MKDPYKINPTNRRNTYQTRPVSTLPFDDTCLLHYTRIDTQPLVSHKHNHGDR
jgi:hypothetical protein